MGRIKGDVFVNGIVDDNEDYCIGLINVSHLRMLAADQWLSIHEIKCTAKVRKSLRSCTFVVQISYLCV